VFALVVLGTAVGDNRILQSSDLSKELFHFVLKKNNILLELDEVFSPAKEVKLWLRMLISSSFVMRRS
jgi:hypothetical protein